MLRKITLLVTVLVAIGNARALTVFISVQNEICGNLNGSLYANASGGVPPYFYDWSSGATTAGINGLGPGFYSVTVTDSEGTEVLEDATIIAVDHTDQFSLLGDAFCPLGGIATPFARWSPFGAVGDAGPPPYSFNGNVVAQDPFIEQELYNVPIPAATGEAIQMQYMDGDGCGGTIWATAGYPVEWPTVTILQVEGSCAVGANGSVLVAYGAEGHGYSVDSEIRDALNNIAVLGGWNWYGQQPTTIQFDGLAPGDHSIYQRLSMAQGSNYYTWCADLTTFTIPDLGMGCGNVNGSVYVDNDVDCDLEGSDTRIPGAILAFLPGPYYSMANSNGVYSINLPPGAYTVEHQAVDVAQYCPAPPAPVNVIGTQTVDIADTSVIPLDAEVMIASGAARPGFQLNYGIQLSNLTPANSGATSTVMIFDPAVTFLSASPSPTSVNGNILTWNQNTLGAFQQRSIQVRFQVPPDVGLIGTVLNASVTLTTQNADSDPANNTVATSVEITGSYDPNDKVATTSSGASSSSYFIDADEWVDYTIRFQNTGTDTAFNVVVTDTLPSTLDPSSILWGATSHGCMRSLTGHGIVKFIFPNILLPDSNVNEAASHGFASFRIKPHLPIVAGTVIENSANIYFDFNEAVITEPSVLVAEFSTGISHEHEVTLGLSPVPVREKLLLSCKIPIASMVIVGLDGREAFHRNVYGSTMEIDVADATAGTYVLVATLTDGTVVRERFIKQ